MPLMGLLAEIFTWWNGRTIGTRLYTARKGELVGEDGQGNKYYRNNDNTRRWVIYNGEVH
ncbi:MAG: NADH-ubiquinone oxidoreductase subunit NDUFA12 family protein, partial [Alphaproteobacteria bacterium]